MPTLIPRPLYDNLLHRIEQASTFNAEATTRLSEMLAELESKLKELPFKHQITVKNGPDDPFALSFDRWKGDWALLVPGDDESRDVDDDGRRELTSASVDTKLRAAPLILQLLEEIASAQEAIAQRCRRASECFQSDEHKAKIAAKSLIAGLPKAPTAKTRSDNPPSEYDAPAPGGDHVPF